MSSGNKESDKKETDRFRKKKRKNSKNFYSKKKRI